MQNNLIGEKMKTYNFVKILGEGSWAQVYLAIDQRDKSQIAIKCISKKTIKQTPKLQQLVKSQIKVLKSCNNENVIKYIDSFQSPLNVFIATQFCNGGDLQQYLNQKKHLTEGQATMFLKQILNGFKGLHQIGAMHRDFKLANLLLHNSVCKIADLGFSKVLGKLRSKLNDNQPLTGTVLGTSLTMAPQVLQQKLYGFQADIWSVGVVYYQMIYGKYPYQGLSDMDLVHNIKKNQPNFESFLISKQAKEFICKCLTYDPKKRISWRDIYDHPLLLKNQGAFYGSLQSKIKITENKKIYQNLPQNIKYPSLMDQFQQIGDIRKSSNMAALLKQSQKKRQIELQINNHQKLYLTHRNDIMFIFKFIQPFIYSLFEIAANHQIAMFILSKNSYWKLKQLSKSIAKKQNIFGIKKYWQEFIDSIVYENIKKQIQDDKQMVALQCSTYRDDIKHCSSSIKKQFDIDLNQEEFNKLFQQTIEDYWYLLAQGLDKLKDDQKKDLIKVLSALFYLKSSQKNSLDQFDRIMAKINFQKAQIDIRKKKQEIYKM